MMRHRGYTFELRATNCLPTGFIFGRIFRLILLKLDQNMPQQFGKVLQKSQTVEIDVQYFKKVQIMHYALSEIIL